METKLISIKEAAKLFSFPRDKLYQLADKGEVPYIIIESLSGAKKKVINVKTFAEWLDELSREQKVI